MNTQTKTNTMGRTVLEAEVDLSAAAAVSATRGNFVTCTKSSTATYTFVFKGNAHGLKMYKVIGRDVRLGGTPATAVNAIVTSATQATDGSDDITVVVKTTNASWVETATTGACNLGLTLVFESTRNDMPFA